MEGHFEVNESDWQTLFVRLGATQVQLSIVVTGGGSGVIQRCFRRPGASRNFVEANVPYSRPALAAFLGEAPIDGSVSQTTVIHMAEVARRRAERLGDRETPIAAGLAITAALPTEPPSEFASRVYIAIDSCGIRRQWLETFDKTMDRLAAEARVEALTLKAVWSIVELSEAARR